MPTPRSRATPRALRTPAGPPAFLPRALAAVLVLLGTALPAAAQWPVQDTWGGPEPRELTIEQVIEIIRTGEGPVLIDARSHGEYLEGHIPTALNVPHKETWGRVDEFRRFADRGIVFYCVQGVRSRIAAEGLIGEGFPKVGVMRGHLREWKRRDLPLVR